MKKIILGFIATVFLASATYAQADVYAKSSMVVMVTHAQKTFVKGTSYQDWITVQIGNNFKPSTQEEKLLKEVYGFLSSQAQPDAIYKSYSGTSLAEWAQFEKKAGLNATANNDVNRSWWWWLIRKIVDIYIDLYVLMP